MDEALQTSLTDLIALCAAADEADTLLMGALPLVRRLAGAEAALVVRRQVDGHGLAAHDGCIDSPEGLEAALGLTDEGLVELPLPSTWEASGLTRVSGRVLPGNVGVLVLGWSSDDARPSTLEPSNDLLDTALNRLVAEERLADLTLRVNNAQQLANMGDYDWHIASDTNRWSDQLYRIYGHEPQSFNASYERFLGHIHPDDREKITAIHQTAYATGEPYQMIERVVRPDGEVRYLSSNGQVVMDEQGTPVRMRGTCVDITDRVLAEEDRTRTAARFQALVESSPDAILVLDRTGKVVQTNGKADDLLGGSAVDVPVGSILELPEGGVGRNLVAASVNGQRLTLDVMTADLSQTEDDGQVAVFLHDSQPRLASEAAAASLREAQVRRRSAMEINDNVLQGLTAAVYAADSGDLHLCGSYLQQTLQTARRMINDLLLPLDGSPVKPGDLVRSSPAGLDPAQAAPLVAVGDAAEQSRLNRILIVDDSEDMRVLLRMRLKSLETCEVVGEAADGEEAVSQSAALQPDLVLLDLAMPRMDGLQALPLIRKAAPGARIIVLSGFAQQAMSHQAMTAGADKYLEKGSAGRELAAAIEQVLAG